MAGISALVPSRVRRFARLQAQPEVFAGRRSIEAVMSEILFSAVNCALPAGQVARCSCAEHEAERTMAMKAARKASCALGFSALLSIVISPRQRKLQV
jgi:hypothetical protein